MKISDSNLLIKSLFNSKNIYTQIAYFWKGTKINWLVFSSFLSSVSNLILLLIYYNQSNIDINSYINYVIKQVPTMEIINGELNIKNKQPYFIKNQNNNILFIIDTTSKINSIENNESIALITDKKLYMKLFSNKISEYNIADIVYRLFKTTNITINQEMIIKIFDSLKSKFDSSFAFVIFIFIFFGTFTSELIRISIYSLIAFFILSIKNYKLPMLSIVRLAIMSNIPVTILKITILCLLNIITSKDISNLIAFVISINYFYFAIKSSISKS